MTLQWADLGFAAQTLRHWNLLTTPQLEKLLEENKFISYCGSDQLLVHLRWKWWQRHLKRRLGDEAKDDVMIEQVGCQVAAVLEKHCTGMVSDLEWSSHTRIALDFQLSETSQPTDHHFTISAYGSGDSAVIDRVLMLNALYLSQFQSAWLWHCRKVIRRLVRPYAILPLVCKRIGIDA